MVDLDVPRWTAFGCQSARPAVAQPQSRSTSLSRTAGSLGLKYDAERRHIRACISTNGGMQLATYSLSLGVWHGLSAVTPVPAQWCAASNKGTPAFTKCRWDNGFTIYLPGLAPYVCLKVSQHSPCTLAGCPNCCHALPCKPGTYHVCAYSGNPTIILFFGTPEDCCVMCRYSNNNDNDGGTHTPARQHKTKGTQMQVLRTASLITTPLPLVFKKRIALMP